MNILAIDTSTDWCGVSFFENSRCKSKIEEHAPKKHSEILPKFFEKIVEDVGFVKKDLDAVAVSIGPGSFTGLRIGLGFSKGLAYALNKPIVPVPTLEVIANNPVVSFNGFLVLLFSHRNIVYVQKFLNKKPQSDAVASIFDEVDLKNNIVQYGCEKLLGSNLYLNARPDAEVVGYLALRNFNEWKIEKPYTLTSNYVSPFEIG